MTFAPLTTNALSTSDTRLVMRTAKPHSNSASFESCDRNTPSKPATNQLRAPPHARHTRIPASSKPCRQIKAKLVQIIDDVRLPKKRRIFGRRDRQECGPQIRLSGGHRFRSIAATRRRATGKRLLMERMAASVKIPDGTNRVERASALQKSTAGTHARCSVATHAADG